MKYGFRNNTDGDLVIIGDIVPAGGTVVFVDEADVGAQRVGDVNASISSLTQDLGEGKVSYVIDGTEHSSDELWRELSLMQVLTANKNKWESLADVDTILGRAGDECLSFSSALDRWVGVRARVHVPGVLAKTPVSVVFSDIDYRGTCDLQLSGVMAGAFEVTYRAKGSPSSPVSSVRFRWEVSYV